MNKNLDTPKKIRKIIVRDCRIVNESLYTHSQFEISMGKVSKKALESLSEIGLTEQNRPSNKNHLDQVIKQFYDTQKDVLVSRSYYGGIAIWNVSFEDPENPEKRKIVAGAWESWRDYTSHQNVKHNIEMFKELTQAMNE